MNLNKELQRIVAASQTVKVREFFQTILGINSICIGGSAALLLAHDIYLDRPVHDIDVILEEKDFKLVTSKIFQLQKFFDFKIKVGSYPKDKKEYPSLSFTFKNGTEVNILIGKHPEGQWQSLEEIIKAKQAYNRSKDYRDLIIILG